MPLPTVLGRVTTADVYRSGHTPPAAPDVAGITIHLQGRYRNTKPAPTYTHRAYIALGIDVRDGDLLCVPNQNGTRFTVVRLGRVRSLGGMEVKSVLLNRQAAPPWPTQNL